MKTELLEFKNSKNQTLRGILVLPNRTKKAVIMMAGFEGSATTEKKFKALSDELYKKGIASFRFDYTGCGISDGDFGKITIAQITNDLERAYDALKRKIGLNQISITAHSMGTCAIANLESKNIFDKIILLAPALNQKELLRYWLVQHEEEKNNPKFTITWKNFRKFLDENKFLEFSRRTDRMTHSNYISSEYYMENAEKNYTNLLVDRKVFLIHGEKDDVVPIESLENKLKTNVLVKNGDHDLERPDMIKQWTNKVVNYIVK